MQPVCLWSRVGCVYVRHVCAMCDACVPHVSVACMSGCAPVCPSSSGLALALCSCRLGDSGPELLASLRPAVAHAFFHRPEILSLLAQAWPQIFPSEAMEMQICEAAVCAWARSLGWG